MIFTRKSLYLQYHEPLKLLRWQWQGALSLSRFQEAFQELLFITLHYDVQRWMADTRGLPPLGPQEQAWLSEEWLPEFGLNTAVHHLALILPDSLHNQLVLESALHEAHQYDCGLIQFFSCAPAALDWLAHSPGEAEMLEHQWQVSIGARKQVA
ncbi:hypothetical protein [Hymenobacter sp. BT730]|uniref:hypothetical protein n=1 Tax=Hymenobacter sp. BT730 TaxID=3063332 RepID=UPI0026DEEEA3|nr:hypothetical protein [Hymenobacter sp. BT730]